METDRYVRLVCGLQTRNRALHSMLERPAYVDVDQLRRTLIAQGEDIRQLMDDLRAGGVLR